MRKNSSRFDPCSSQQAGHAAATTRWWSCPLPAPREAPVASMVSCGDLTHQSYGI